MSVAPAVLEHYPELTESQRAVVGHLDGPLLVETCPRQYQFFRLYDFTPSRSAVLFFSLLVHQSIEAIHRIALDGRLDVSGGFRRDPPSVRILVRGGSRGHR